MGITETYETMYPVEDNKDLILTAVRDWHIISTTLDRLSFFSYSMALAVGTGLLYPYPEDLHYAKPSPHKWPYNASWDLPLNSPWSSELMLSHVAIKGHQKDIVIKMHK